MTVAAFERDRAFYIGGSRFVDRDSITQGRDVPVAYPDQLMLHGGSSVRGIEHEPPAWLIHHPGDDTIIMQIREFGWHAGLFYDGANVRNGWKAAVSADLRKRQNGGGGL